MLLGSLWLISTESRTQTYRSRMVPRFAKIADSWDLGELQVNTHQSVLPCGGSFAAARRSYPARAIIAPTMISSSARSHGLPWYFSVTGTPAAIASFTARRNSRSARRSSQPVRNCLLRFGLKPNFRPAPQRTRKAEHRCVNGAIPLPPVESILRINQYYGQSVLKNVKYSRPLKSISK